MKYPPNHFDFKKIEIVANRLSVYLQVEKLVKLKQGEVLDIPGRYGDRVNSRPDLQRIVFGALVVREDGSGHGPPLLAEKIVSISINGFA